MAYESKPNTGSLFKNDYKTAENHPDMKGDVFLDRDLMEDMLKKHKDSMIKFSLSAWTKQYGNGKKMLSLNIGEPWEGGQSKPKATVSDDDLPY
jgi:hypothetical protein